MADAAGEQHADDEAAVKAIRAHGWKQGSVLSSAMRDSVLEYLPPHIGWNPDRGLCLVSGHDCDINNRSLSAEPVVEIICAEPCPAIDGQMAYGKNNRTLHVELSVAGKPQPVEIKAFDRFYMPRRLLAEEPPDTTHSMDSRSRQIFRAWLASRYNRTALPDNFNDRLSSVRGKLRKAVGKTRGQHISGLYITLSSLDELGSEIAYEALLVGTMPVDSYDDLAERTAAIDALDKFAALLQGCEGIEVHDSELKPESEFTLDDLRFCQRFDFDDLSLRSEDAATPAEWQ